MPAMTAPAHTQPALGLKLRRGAKSAAGLEIIDASTGRIVALILDGDLTAILEPLILASPDLLWATVRASAHLNCERSAESNSEARRLCKLLRDASDLATRTPKKHI